MLNAEQETLIVFRLDTHSSHNTLVVIILSNLSQKTGLHQQAQPVQGCGS